MQKRLGAVATTLALAAGSVVAIAGPATADSPGCVSKPEFRAAQKGWSQTHVANRFDTGGKQVFVGFGTQQRQYKTCSSQYGFVDIDFSRKAGVWRLQDKQAYWG